MAIDQVWEQPELYDPTPRNFNAYGQGRRRKAVVILSLVWGGNGGPPLRVLGSLGRVGTDHGGGLAGHPPVVGETHS